MNTNFYQSFIKSMSKRFDKQNTSNLGQDAVAFPGIVAKRGARNVALKRSIRYPSKTDQNFADGGIFISNQNSTGPGSVASVLRRQWISLALVGSLLTGGLVTSSAQAQSRVFFYSNYRAGAVGHVTAASQIAIDWQQGPGTFGP